MKLFTILLAIVIMILFALTPTSANIYKLDDITIIYNDIAGFEALKSTIKELNTLNKNAAIHNYNYIKYNELKQLLINNLKTKTTIIYHTNS